MRWIRCALIVCGICSSSLWASNPMAAAMAAADKKPATPAATSSKESNPMAAAMAATDKKSATPASAPVDKPSATPASAPEAKSSTAPVGTSAHKSDTTVKKTSEKEASSDLGTGDVSKPTLEIEDVYSSGLDTVHIDSGGNWLEKRIWFKKAEQLFDEIRNVIKKLADIRMDFVHEVNQVAQKIDEFYENVNLEKGQIDQLLKDVLDEVSQASFKRGGDLSSKERNLKLSVQNEQKQITQISDDIKKIDDFDNQIDKTMQQAFKVIDLCRKYESKAWDDFKEIGTELDDKKARVLYYQMENAQKNIEQNIKYLDSTLLPYLKTKLVAPGIQTMNNIKSTLKSLDDKGINLEKMLKGDEKADEDTVKKREEEKEHEVEEKWEEQQKKKEEAEKKAKEEAAKKAKEEAEEKREQIWYNRMMREACCAVKSAAQWVCCTVVGFGQKIAGYSPSTTKEVKEMLSSAYDKVVHIPSLLHGYIKQIVCTVKDFICHLMGH